MKQSLQLRLGQHLAMTPQLQQAIRLLQLSTLELQTEVQEALDSNLMLESEDDFGESQNTSTDRKNGSELQGAGFEDDVKPADIPTELAVDSVWEDVYDNTNFSSTYSGDTSSGEFEVQRSAPETLRDHLNWQLDLLNISATDSAIGEAVIDAIDDDGYLKSSLDDIRQCVRRGGREVSEDEVEAVLHLVQTFDPAGVGARDLRDCLLIQLNQLVANTPWRSAAIEVVSEHLELLGAQELSTLLRRMDLDIKDLEEVVALIRSLDPRPGANAYSPPPEYVIPDVFVKKINGVWTVELNQEASPKLRINTGYAGLIKRADNSPDNTCLRTHLQEARWFLKSLQSRSETLLRVATSIVQSQHQFLEYGAEAMRPMVLHDIADTVGMHESTISRVTTQKYMHTPRGIFELKYFFSSHVSTAAGGEASSTAIRALLKKLIAAENPRKPLSDNKLAGILCEQGINVARRTVAKYREALTIPSSSDRKRLV